MIIDDHAHVEDLHIVFYRVWFTVIDSRGWLQRLSPVWVDADRIFSYLLVEKEVWRVRARINNSVVAGYQTLLGGSAARISLYWSVTVSISSGRGFVVRTCID